MTNKFKMLGLWLVMSVFLLVSLVGCGTKISSGTNNSSTNTGNANSSSGNSSSTNTGSSKATSKAPSLKGQTISMIIPYGPGGGYDTYARFLGPVLQTVTGATVVPKNVEGGGSLIGINQVFKDKPDGRTIAIGNGTALTLSQLTGDKGVQYDLTKFTVLGRMSADDEYIFMGKNSKYNSLEKLLAAKDAPIKWVTEGAAGSPYYRTVLMSEALRLTNAKILTGYTGSADSDLAIIRGDADGTAGTYSSRQSQVDSGEFVPVVILAKERSKQFPNTPTIYEIPNLNDNDKKLIDFMVGLDQLGRLFLAPPGMDSATAELLQSSFKTALEDPAAVDMANKQKLVLSYLAPADVQKMISDVLQAPADIQKRINDALAKYKK